MKPCPKTKAIHTNKTKNKKRKREREKAYIIPQQKYCFNYNLIKIETIGKMGIVTHADNMEPTLFENAKQSKS